MEGIYRGINGNLIQIDSKYYKFAKPQFAPKQTNVMVSFSTDKADPTVCTYIKVKEAGETGPVAAAPAAPAATVEQAASPAPAPAAEAKPAYQKKAYGSYGNKSGGSSSFNTKKDTSIIRQVIFKAASEQVAAGKGVDIKAEYDKLKALFEKELLGD